VASAHYDMSNNIACCLVGRRRFTLFPPEQVENLYPGPLEPTPGGQVVSMVDFDGPISTASPASAAAAAAAKVAELEPGDVLFYPALWWHQVEALDPFNVLVNYWWNTSPAFMDTPMTPCCTACSACATGPISRSRPGGRCSTTTCSGPPDRPAAHLPEAARGDLGPLDERSPAACGPILNR
jgi:hypothetical protein